VSVCDIYDEPGVFAFMLCARTFESYRYQTQPDARYLIWPLPCVSHDLEVNYSWNKTKSLGGWEAANQNPRTYRSGTGLSSRSSHRQTLRNHIIDRGRETVKYASDQDHEHSKSSYAWLTEFVTSAEVVTSVLTSAISGILNVAETLTDTPNVDDSVEKISPVRYKQWLDGHERVTVHVAELLKPCWNPS